MTIMWRWAPPQHCSSRTCVRTCDLYVCRMWPSTPPELRHAGPRFSQVSLARVPPKHWLGFPPVSERGCVPRGHDGGNHVGRRHVPTGESLHQGLGGGSSRGHNGGQGEESCKYNVSAATVTWSRCMEHMTKQIWLHVSLHVSVCLRYFKSIRKKFALSKVIKPFFQWMTSRYLFVYF